MDTLAVDLARFQFAFTVSFHIIFPAFTIGLASYLAVLEGLWLKTGKEKYIQLYKYWIKIFAVSFGMGVVSGIVLSYQFGTNRVSLPIDWPHPWTLMGYEVFTAFFLEAVSKMLFGMDEWAKAALYVNLHCCLWQFFVCILDIIRQQLDANQQASLLTKWDSLSRKSIETFQSSL